VIIVDIQLIYIGRQGTIALELDDTIMLKGVPNSSSISIEDSLYLSSIRVLLPLEAKFI